MDANSGIAGGSISISRNRHISIKVQQIVSKLCFMDYQKSTSSIARQQQSPTLPKTEITGSKPLKEQGPSNRILEATNSIICASWPPKTQQMGKVLL